MISKFLDPKNDVAFKKIFGSEKNKDILIHFLNDILVFKEKNPIVEVSFLKTVQDPDTAAKKTSIVDILCTDEKGIHYIVEMQVAQTTGFEKRAQYYASKAYSSQAKIGDEYISLKEVVFLAIANYIVFPAKKEYKSDHVILDKKTYEHDLQDFSFTFMELPKFTKKLEELSNIQEKWCYFFKHAGDTSAEDLKKIIGDDRILERAYEELDRFFWTEEELLIYEQTEKRLKDYTSSLRYQFNKGEEKGLAKGLAKGREEGLAKGREEGLAKGREEGLAKGLEEGLVKGRSEIVKKMVHKLLREKAEVSFIASILDLSEAEVESIEEEMGAFSSSRPQLDDLL